MSHCYSDCFHLLQAHRGSGASLGTAELRAVPGGDGVMASMGMMASVGRMALGAAPAHTRPLTESSDLPSSLEKAPLLQEVKG